MTKCFCSVPNAVPNVICFGKTHEMATGDRQQARGNGHCIKQQAISNRQKTIDTDPTHGQEEEEEKKGKTEQHEKQEVEGRWPRRKGKKKKRTRRREAGLMGRRRKPALRTDHGQKKVRGLGYGE